MSGRRIRVGGTAALASLLPLQAVLGQTPAAARLNVGDKAPALAITEWVRGEAVDLAKGVGKRVYVVEFWATWCAPCIRSIPHLDKLQARFKDKNLTVIGVSSNEALQTVKTFLGKQKETMQYTVAADDANKTYQSYMAGIEGIPHAFVIDKKGVIVWHGHPEFEMDSVVEQVLEGKYDVDAARTQAANAAKIDVLLNSARNAYAQGKMEESLGALTEILALDPANMPSMRNSLIVIREGLKDPARVRTWALSLIEKHADHAKGLSTLASVLMTPLPLNDPSRTVEDELGDRDPELIVRCARTAYQASKRLERADAAVIATYAQAMHAVGQLDEAIRLQSEAVDAADGEPKTQQQKVLDYFRACKALADGSSAGVGQ